MVNSVQRDTEHSPETQGCVFSFYVFDIISKTKTSCM